MTKIFTNYDILNVAQNAPPEIIHAAYRAIAQEFHPDNNPGDQDAARSDGICKFIIQKIV